MQRMNRWERQYTDAADRGDTSAEEHALGLFTAAVDDLTERSSRLAPPPPPPPPPRLDPHDLRNTSGDDLERLWAQHQSEPDNQLLIEKEWARRDLARRGSADEVIIPPARHLQLVNALSAADDLTDMELKEAWLDGHTDPEIRQLAEDEMDRRMLTRTEHPGDDPSLCEAVDARLEHAWAKMRPHDYRRYEATLVTDPRLRMPENAAGRRLTNRELEGEYAEYCYERYLAAEAASQGHLLNRRGQALKVDPSSLMSGNAKRMEAYASDEFKAFIGSTGGHMSFARFKAARSGRDYDTSRVERFADAVSA
ncbi:hypothetical protein [Gordonia alkanivorans]|uniref:hypothetical protein n=1 Tax=Gordonia alkanivorans TaxID=84096 RepID=UPI0004B1A005|nr:hypothetical protein [Gordonia alkanivorans]